MRLMYAHTQTMQRVYIRGYVYLHRNEDYDCLQEKVHPNETKFRVIHVGVDLIYYMALKFHRSNSFQTAVLIHFQPVTNEEVRAFFLMCMHCNLWICL